MAWRISSSVGVGFFSRKAWLVMIMPGVQKPHCRPCSGHEAFLEGMQGAVLLEAFDGHNLAPVGLHREHRARLHGPAVENDRAGPAVGGVAADMGAGEAEHLADEVDEEQAGLDVRLVLLTVDRHLDRA